MRKAIELEAAVEGEDIEGFELEPLDVASDSPSPPALAPLSSTDGPPTSSSLAYGPALSLGPIQRRAKEAQHRKQKGNARRTIRRQIEKSAARDGEYTTKPRIIDRYVRPAKPITTKLQTKKLGHTKNAYTGARDKGGRKRTHELKDLVGEGSLGFKLIEWKGK